MGGGSGGSRDKEVTVASAPGQAPSFTKLLIAGVAASAGGTIGNGEQRQSWQPAAVPEVASDCVVISHPGKGAEGVSTYSFSASRFGDAPPIGMVPAPPFNFASSGDMAHYSLAQDQLAAAPPAPAGDYNLNFSMSSGFLGANRGTLQSNLPSHLSGHPSVHFLPAWPRHRGSAPVSIRGPMGHRRDSGATGRRRDGGARSGGWRHDGGDRPGG
ncbi:hypothetical protein E2562_035136 [Oryza meyeriana var. granulata]|uniref:Uncharacterized protein n=1 Tax=Oryza meyeriana var. granulata TaxID=110450 RepID=A0A6G1BPW1_9ORYZ|nr:hypothetical protein E2562_035136 [Oryza meyeriana var. granulata]